MDVFEERPGTWPDMYIKEWLLQQGADFDHNDIQPASVDVHLGSMIQVAWRPWRIPGAWRVLWPLHQRWPEKFPRFGHRRPLTEYLLKPQEFVLVSTRELIVAPPNADVTIMMRSTPARLGLNQSWTKGDPGWAGFWTLELYNLAPWPFLLKRGDSIAQAVYHGMAAIPHEIYDGFYQDAHGIVATKTKKP